ncbi:MAG: hypothetical protein KTR31_07465 [Myxococcales bacterium]|nr:hypothetical protein [Myxococcales bacterium]
MRSSSILAATCALWSGCLPETTCAVANVHDGDTNVAVDVRIVLDQQHELARDLPSPRDDTYRFVDDDGAEVPHRTRWDLDRHSVIIRPVEELRPDTTYHLDGPYPPSGIHYTGAGPSPVELSFSTGGPARAVSWTSGPSVVYIAFSEPVDVATLDGVVSFEGEPSVVPLVQHAPEIVAFSIDPWPTDLFGDANGPFVQAGGLTSDGDDIAPSEGAVPRYTRSARDRSCSPYGDLP